MTKPFILAVRVVLFDQTGHILLLKRSEKSSNNPGKWELPGGKLEEGETFDQALKRETLEETGFSVMLHTAAGTAMQEREEARIVNLVMIGTMISGGLSISKEHEEYRWVTPQEMASLEKADWFEEYYRMFLQGIPQEPQEDEK